MKDEIPSERTPKPQASVPPPSPPRGTGPAAAADDADRPRKEGRVQIKRETVRITLPSVPSGAPTFRLPTIGVSAEVAPKRDSLWFPILQHVVVLTLAFMVLDFGEIFQIVGYAAFAYWGGFLLLFARRRNQLTRTDRILIRWGFLILCGVSALFTGLIWHVRGFSH